MSTSLPSASATTKRNTPVATAGHDLHATFMHGTNYRAAIFIDANAGRTQSGVRCTRWAEPSVVRHDVPPYDANDSRGTRI